MKKLTFIFITIIVLFFFPGCHKNDEISKAGTFYGKKTLLGDGFVRSFITLKKDGTPSSIGFNFSETMLNNLPSPKEGATGDENFMDTLDLPPEAAASGYEHMELDWDPHGHVPLPIYGFPHFDFHYYLVGENKLINVVGGPDTQPVDPQYIPKDYVSGIMAVPHMGVHWHDSLSSEFHGTMFTNTLLYGFYHSQMLFLEQMITKAYLETHADISVPVKQPLSFQKPGYYPLSYQIHFDATKKEYNVSLEILSKHD
jgi:hypothetical protein